MLQHFTKISSLLAFVVLFALVLNCYDDYDIVFTLWVHVLQPLQIMSMGTGLCMPPMMFPTGMQHMHPHFSPMGIGMGMGYGMGMDMNGGPQRHPHMFPFPPSATQGSRHPPPVYGHPSQGMQMLFPQQPMPGIPVNPVVRRMDVAPSSKEHHVITQISSQVLHYICLF